MSMKKDIADLWHKIEMSGRKTNALAVQRLVAYWAVRTPFTVSEVCAMFSVDLSFGRPLSFKRHGFF